MRFRRSLFSSHPSYTLIELMMVIAIIAIIVLASVGSYRYQRELQVFKGAARHIDELLKGARSAALAGKAEAVGDSTTPSAWGVYFCLQGAGSCQSTPRGAVVNFQDTYPAMQADNKLATVKFSREDLIAEDYVLPDKVVVTKLRLKVGEQWQDANEAVVLFQSPRADVTISNNGGLTGSVLEATVQLALDSPQAVMLRVDAIAGKIEFSNQSS